MSEMLEIPRRDVKVIFVGCMMLFSVALGTSDLGFIPVPTAAGRATTMHLPTIIASVIVGWPAGMVVGFIFGVTSMLTAPTALFKDPIVAVLPRLFVGLTPYFIYIWLKNRNTMLALAAAAAVGTMTNTVLVLGAAVVRGYIQLSDVPDIVIKHGLPEIVVAIVIILPVAALCRRLRLL